MFRALIVLMSMSLLHAAVETDFTSWISTILETIPNFSELGFVNYLLNFICFAKVGQRCASSSSCSVRRFV